MDAIEGNVILPDGARNLDEYGRSYALDGLIVVGHYLVPTPQLTQDVDCERMTLDGGSEPCAEDWRAMREENQALQLQAGERSWYTNLEDLPVIFDGGCSMVTVRYDTARRQFLSVSCNGRA